MRETTVVIGSDWPIATDCGIAAVRLALNAGWDSEVLAGELQALIEIGFDVELTGFSLAEIDLTIAEAEQSKPSGKDSNDDQIPPLRTTAATRPGTSGCSVGIDCCAATPVRAPRMRR